MRGTLAPAEQLGLVTVDRTGLQLLPSPRPFRHLPLRAFCAAGRCAPRARRAPCTTSRTGEPGTWPPPPCNRTSTSPRCLRPPPARRSAAAGRPPRRWPWNGRPSSAPTPREQARRLVAAASAAVPTGQGDWVQELASRAHGGHRGPGAAADRPPRRRMGAGLVRAAQRRAVRRSSPSSKRHRVTSRPSPGTRSGARPLSPTSPGRPLPPGRHRALALLERQSPCPPGQVPGIDINVLRLWISASADPIGRRNQLLPSLHNDRQLAHRQSPPCGG